jgi:hypothetical protein
MFSIFSYSLVRLFTIKYNVPIKKRLGMLDTEIKLVLRGDDYKGFDLERVFKIVSTVAARLEFLSY